MVAMVTSEAETAYALNKARDETEQTVFITETQSAVFEVQAEAEETVEHRR
jgi:hypothetical protein